MKEQKNFRKLLVPVDYSEYSQLASRYALKIAQKADAEIMFFHAFYSPAYDLIELTGNRNTQIKLKTDVTNKLLIEETDIINKFIESNTSTKEFASFPKEKLKFVIRPGLIKVEISQFSEEYDPDLVIMGTRGKDKKESSVFGSITEFAINKLNYPILAIPENYTFIGDENLKKIVYLTDFDESDFLSIKKLMEFINFMNLEIYCVHIGETSDSWDKIKLDGLKQYFKSAYKKMKVECAILPQENILQSLDSFIKEKKINLVSLTSRKRNIIEKLIKPNITKKLFYHSNIPILVFRF